MFYFFIFIFITLKTYMKLVSDVQIQAYADWFTMLACYFSLQIVFYIIYICTKYNVAILHCKNTEQIITQHVLLYFCNCCNIWIAGASEVFI